MQIKKVKKNAGRPRKDPKKEFIFRKLVEALKSGGYTVRREELKQGPGWRVVSGACRFHADTVIFVDRRLTQEDQIAFLVSQMVNRNLTVSEETLAELPEEFAATLRAALLREKEQAA